METAKQQPDFLDHLVKKQLLSPEVSTALRALYWEMRDAQATPDAIQTLEKQVRNLPNQKLRQLSRSKLTGAKKIGALLNDVKNGRVSVSALQAIPQPRQLLPSDAPKKKRQSNVVDEAFIESVWKTAEKGFKKVQEALLDPDDALENYTWHFALLEKDNQLRYFDTIPSSENDRTLAIVSPNIEKGKSTVVLSMNGTSMGLIPLEKYSEMFAGFVAYSAACSALNTQGNYIPPETGPLAAERFFSAMLGNRGETRLKQFVLEHASTGENAAQKALDFKPYTFAKLAEDVFQNFGEPKSLHELRHRYQLLCGKLIMHGLSEDEIKDQASSLQREFLATAPVSDQLASEMWHGEWQREGRMPATAVRAGYNNGIDGLLLTLPTHDVCRPKIETLSRAVKKLQWFDRSADYSDKRPFCSSGSINAVVTDEAKYSYLQPVGSKGKLAPFVKITNSATSNFWRMIEIRNALEYRHFSESQAPNGVSAFVSIALGSANILGRVIYEEDVEYLTDLGSHPEKYGLSTDPKSFIALLVEDPNRFISTLYPISTVQRESPQSPHELKIQLLTAAALAAGSIVTHENKEDQDVLERFGIRAVNGLVTDFHLLEELATTKFQEIRAAKKTIDGFIEDWKLIRDRRSNHDERSLEGKSGQAFFDTTEGVIRFLNFAMVQSKRDLIFQRSELVPSVPRIITIVPVEYSEKTEQSPLMWEEQDTDGNLRVSVLNVPVSPGWRGVMFNAMGNVVVRKLASDSSTEEQLFEVAKGYHFGIVDAADRCTHGKIREEIQQSLSGGDPSALNILNYHLTGESEREAINAVKRLNFSCCEIEQPLSEQECQVRTLAYMYEANLQKPDILGGFPQQKLLNERCKDLARLVMADYRADDERQKKALESQKEDLTPQVIVQETISVETMRTERLLTDRERAAIYYTLASMELRSFRDTQEKPFSAILKRIEQDYDKLPVAGLLERSIQIADQALEEIPLRTSRPSSKIFPTVTRLLKNLDEELFSEAKIGRLSHERREELVLGCAFSLRKFTASIELRHRELGLQSEFQAMTEQYLYPLLVSYSRTMAENPLLGEVIRSIHSYSAEDRWSNDAKETSNLLERKATSEAFINLKKALLWDQVEKRHIQDISEHVVSLESKLERGRPPEAIPAAMLRGRKASSLILHDNESGMNLTLQLSRTKGRYTISLFSTVNSRDEDGEDSLLARDLNWPTVRKPWGHLNSAVMIENDVTRGAAKDLISGASMVGGLPYGWDFTVGSPTAEDCGDRLRRHSLLKRLPALHSKISHEVGVRCHHLFRDTSNFRECDVLIADEEVYLIFNRESLATMKIATDGLSPLGTEQKQDVLNLLEQDSNRFANTEVIKLVNQREREKELGWKIEAELPDVNEPRGPQERRYDGVRGLEVSSSWGESHDVDIDDARRALLLGVLSGSDVKGLDAYADALQASDFEVAVYELEKGRVLYDASELDCVFIWQEDSGRVYFIPHPEGRSYEQEELSSALEHDLVPMYHAIVPPWNDGDIGAWVRAAETFIEERRAGERYPVFPTHAVEGRHFSLVFEIDWYESSKFYEALKRDLTFVATREGVAIEGLQARNFRAINSGEFIWSVGGPGGGDTYIKRLARGFRFAEGVNLSFHNTEGMNEIVEYAVWKLSNHGESS